MTANKSSAKRWLKISVRSFHLLAIAGVSGGIFFDLPFSDWQWFWYGAVFTGIGLIFLDAISNLLWFVQVRGVAIYLKMALLFAIGHHPLLNQLALGAIILLSGIIAHAPSHIRYYSVVHRRMVKSGKDIKG